MSRSRALGRGVAPALFAVGWLLLAGCTEVIDHGATECGPSSCDGCCNALGQCVQGDSVVACGLGGLACATCAAADRCEQGACVAPDPDPDPLPDGGTGTTCGPSSCAGCCANGTCVAVADQSAAACGTSGAACLSCGAGWRCEDGACRTVPACDLRTSATSGRLEFGKAPVGAPSTLEVELWNAGTADCVINPAPIWDASSDRNAFNFGEEWTTVTLPPGARRTLPVTFNPYAQRAWADNANAFTFTANDNAASQCPVSATPYGCRRVVVTGEGISSALVPSAPLVPSSVDFGPVATGCESAWREVLLVNESPQLLDVVDVAVLGADFELGSVSIPQQLPAWGALTIRVRFVPTGPGARSGTLVVTDGVNGSRTVPLEANATNAPRTDTFTQTDPAFTDVLFVLHDAPSTDPLQEDLAAAASLLVQHAQSAGGAFRLGVTTSDATQANAGRLQGSPRFVTPGTPNPAGAFAQNVHLGLQHGFDQSLEAARLALLPPVATDPLRNGGFLRAGARMAVVIVTNSTDKSGGPTVSDYAKAISAAVGQPLQSDRFRAWTLSTSGCSTSNRYVQFSTLIGGGCRSLVGSTLQSALDDVTADIFARRTEFMLSAPVDATQPVSVTVDGNQVPAAGYTVDSARNAVRFAAAYQAESGQKLDVTYSPRCHP